jgi:hypothetical protein
MNDDQNEDGPRARPVAPRSDDSCELVGSDVNEPQDASEVEWRTVAAYDQYEASNDGRIRLAATGRELDQHRDAKGYFTVKLQRSWGRGRTPRYVHRLMALAFFGPQPTPEHTDVAHWDGDPGNNTLANLRWATADENAQDSIRHRRGA